MESVPYTEILLRHALCNLTCTKDCYHVDHLIVYLVLLYCIFMTEQILRNTNMHVLQAAVLILFYNVNNTVLYLVNRDSTPETHAYLDNKMNSDS